MYVINAREVLLKNVVNLKSETMLVIDPVATP